ncbi:MAG: AraC family transcriptional regulator [Eubacteriales bacterium]|nr:AraC family transcriptional regulator [Eubacteriales bacterium]
MCTPAYDMTYTDLNPKFLFTCMQSRTEETTFHCHDFVELTFILKGECRFRIDGGEHLVEEGDLIMLNPGTYHQSIPGEDLEHPARECHIAFSDVEFVNCPKGFLPLFQGGTNIVRLPEGTKKELVSLCNAMNQEANSREPGRYFMLKAYLIQVLCLIERFRHQERAIIDVQKGKAPTGREFKSINKKYVIQQIMDYMETHYQEKISLDQIAENMYLSSYYISKLFKSETGDTPINFLISLRMRKAREILDASPECPIQEVAAAVGYEDAYHFSKLFKRYYGLSPMYYKARRYYSDNT